MDALYFFPLAVGIALTPGPNNFCALHHGLREGVVAALVGTTGRVAAFAIFLTVSALGLGAMLLASEAAFNLLKWLGAAYLFWLGVQAWRSPELGGLHSGEAVGHAEPRRWRELIRQEFLLGISNPKAMLLFAAIFPQLSTPPGPPQRSSRRWVPPTCWPSTSRPWPTAWAGARSAAWCAARAPLSA